MTYQVTALKWRPQRFEEVVGQEHVTRTLQNAIRQGRVPHAFLLTGSRGVGKTTTARLLAKALICEQGPTPEPCGVCRFCVDVRDGRSLDVLEIDGASNTGVDNIRELRENAAYAPAAARSKIYIIDEVHMLSTSAFNALLKTLEEPPAHVRFIFATTEVNKVPITIQSRCQRYDFRLLGREEIEGQLRKIVDEEGVRISDASLSVIAGAAEGSLRDSQTLLDQVIAYGGREVKDEELHEALGLPQEAVILRFVGGLVEGQGALCLEVLDEVGRAGFDLRAFTRELLQGLRSLSVLKISGDLSHLLRASREGAAELGRIAAKVSFGKAQSLFDIFLQVDSQIGGASFPRMLLELAVIRAVRLEELEGLQALTERLEALAAGGPAQPEPLPPPGAPAPSPQAPLPEERTAPPADESGGDDVAAAQAKGPSAEAGGREAALRRLVERVKKEGGVMLASFLEHGRVAKVTAEEIEIAFDPGQTLFHDTLRESGNFTLLKRCARELFGEGLEVRIAALEETKDKGARARETDLKKKRRREALEHPLVQGAMEVFDAQIVDVKIF